MQHRSKPLSFNPRAPCGARQDSIAAQIKTIEFQSTRPVRGATNPFCAPFSKLEVSIHAPRAGRDDAHPGHRSGHGCFNPRAPYGARQDSIAAQIKTIEFQSTRPVRGATNPFCAPFSKLEVSIHAPRAGRDDAHPGHRSGHGCFNPRAPCGARRNATEQTGLPKSFNPRAPCGARHRAYGDGQRKGCFNPRAPCGARPCSASNVACVCLFQSTRPVRGATPYFYKAFLDMLVSIHAPRAGRDSHFVIRSAHTRSFNPRAPCGARRFSP